MGVSPSAGATDGAGPLDLAPRAVPPAPPARRRGRKWPAIAVLVLVLVGGAVVVTKFLTSAIDYYCNVDEVGSKDGCESGDRFRVQGVVREGSLERAEGLTTFTIEFNGSEMPVRYSRSSELGGIFQECVPVVVHGRLDGAVFVGDNVEVKHSNEYEAANEERLAEADTESAACKQQG